MNSPEPRSDSPADPGYRLAIASTLSAGAALLLAVVLPDHRRFFTLRSTLLDETRVRPPSSPTTSPPPLVFRMRQATGEDHPHLCVPRRSSRGCRHRWRRCHPGQLSAGLCDRPAGYSASGRKTISSPAATRMLAPVKHGERIGSLYVAVSMSARSTRQLAVFALVSLSIAVLAMLVAYTTARVSAISNCARPGKKADFICPCRYP